MAHWDLPSHRYGASQTIHADITAFWPPKPTAHLLLGDADLGQDHGAGWTDAAKGGAVAARLEPFPIALGEGQ